MQSVCAAAALTLENARLQAELRARLAELQASRARLVEATDTERRRIERDLHDGTQQRLVSIAMALGLAESKLAADRPAIQPVLREARDALTAALVELRELTQGIRPAILVERGLAAALEDLGRRAALPVRLDVSVAGRLPEQLEGAEAAHLGNDCFRARRTMEPGECKGDIPVVGRRLVTRLNELLLPLSRRRHDPPRPDECFADDAVAPIRPDRGCTG